MSHPQRLTFKIWASALILTLFWMDAGCTVRKVQKVDPASVNAQQEQIVGVTTRRGEEVSFDPPGATVRNDTLTARVRGVDYTLPVSDVQRFWVERKGTSTLRTIGLVAGIVVGTLVVAAVIIAATKESCPFVYSWDGEKYVFDAEPYGGAITRGLERDDYSELEHLRAHDGVYRLLFTNEVDETQFTNSAELWVIDHPADARIVADEAGLLYGLRSLSPPLSAVDRKGNDLLPWLRSTDLRIWEPEAVADPDGAVRQEIVLTFSRPEDQTQARLIVNAATGLWGSYMIKKMVELRGRDAPSWLASLGPNSPGLGSLEQWIAQEEIYRLKIEVEEPDGWHVRGSIPGGGPFIAEDRLISLDVSRVRGNRVRIRLRPPYGFWALNSFSMAYDAGEKVSIKRVQPSSAKTSDERDVLPELISQDDRYYAMPNIGDRAEVRFAAPGETPGMNRTVFLHSRGWYELHLNTKRAPDTKLLEKIAGAPDGAARYAAAQFSEWQAGRRK